MRILTRVRNWIGVLAMVVLAGCSSPKSNEPAFEPVPSASAGGVSLPAAAPEPVETPTAEKPVAKRSEEPAAVIVTPDQTLTGQVLSVNHVGRFAVLRFPVGQMPALETTMQVYRRGLKVGELKVTGPQKDDHIVADIRAGECRVGDEVRDR